MNYSDFISKKETLQVKCNAAETTYLPATGMMFFEKAPYPAKRTGSYNYIWTSKMTSKFSSRSYGYLEWHYFFTVSGSFSYAMSIFETRGVAVTLRPGANHFVVTGSA